jgi:type VI secretion system FHA domain protein
MPSHPGFPPPGATPSPFDEPADLPDVDLAPPARPAAPVATPAAAASHAATPPPSAANTGAALAAFFKGAELSGAAPADPLAMMTGLGEAFRTLVAGLRQVLIARATIKGEFRIEQTMIRARGNNPLKFSANDDDALTALLGVGRRTDMAPAAAIEDSLRDLRLHELATMAAMQVAVRALLEELSPDKIRAGTDQGGMAVLPAQRKARAWDAFETRHAQVVQALVDDFDSIFGKSFARAYERALDEISLRERQ